MCPLGRVARRLGCTAQVLALAVGMGLFAGVAQAADTTWHAETLTSSPRGVHITSYWSKGRDRMRAETVIGGHRIVTIVNGKDYHALDVTSGTAITIKRSPRSVAATKKWSRLIGLEGFVIKDRGGEKVKSETLGSRMCDVFVNTDQRGKQTVWVQQEGPEEAIPLRVEVYSRQAGAVIRTDYVQWIEGIELPDRLFEPDARFPSEKFDYDDYVAAGNEGKVPAVMILYGNLLHGNK